MPEEHGRFAPKTQIALALVDPVRESGEPAHPVAAETGRAGWLKTVLGLDYFEGRTWHGWHHHAILVLAAYHQLATEQGGGNLPPFSSLSR